MDPIISVKNLNKDFSHVTALSKVSFEVGVNEALALWGSNGAGKTTLLKCLLGIISFGGDIRVMNLDSRRNGKEVRRNVGYIPQARVSAIGRPIYIYIVCSLDEGLQI